MKALVGAFNQEKALVGAFSVIVKTGCGTDGSFYSTTFILFFAPLTELSSLSWLEDHNRKFGLFINNAWQHPDGRKTYETRSPATGAVLAATTQGTAEDVDTAVEAASQALASWSSLTGFQRAKHLYSIARHVQKHARSEATFVTFISDK